MPTRKKENPLLNGKFTEGSLVVTGGKFSMRVNALPRRAQNHYRAPWLAREYSQQGKLMLQWLKIKIKTPPDVPKPNRVHFHFQGPAPRDEENTRYGCKWWQDALLAFLGHDDGEVKQAFPSSTHWGKGVEPMTIMTYWRE